MLWRATPAKIIWFLTLIPIRFSNFRHQFLLISKISFTFRQWILFLGTKLYHQEPILLLGSYFFLFSRHWLLLLSIGVYHYAQVFFKLLNRRSQKLSSCLREVPLLLIARERKHIYTSIRKRIFFYPWAYSSTFNLCLCLRHARFAGEISALVLALIMLVSWAVTSFGFTVLILSCVKINLAQVLLFWLRMVYKISRIKKKDFETFQTVEICSWKQASIHDKVSCMCSTQI